MHRSRYALLPDGDQNDCHRYFEAIGLGAMPVTSLDPYLYRHLEGSIVFSEKGWNVTELQERLRLKPTVNRRLLFEEYWMEFIESEVGHPMRWWDSTRNVTATLSEITAIVMKSGSLIPSQEVTSSELLAIDGSKSTSHVTNEGIKNDSVLRKRVAQAPAAIRVKNESQLEKNLDSNAGAPNKARHYPNYLSNDVPLENLIARKNVLTVYTGCAIATWSFNGRWSLDNPHDDCMRHKGLEALKRRRVTPNTTSLVQPYDSIYVPILALDQFIELILPYIENDFILISGQRALAPPIPREHYDTLIGHPRIVRWFLQNLSMYAYDPYNPKLSPFTEYWTDTPMRANIELKSNYTKPKDNFIFVSFITKRNNMEARKELPRPEEKVEVTEYFRLMHRSQYVLSPDGDRPECHRHYEAIGLGTMPITSLDPHLYRHLQGNAVFNETRWNMTELEKNLPRNPVVNRRLVFEEYWMEYFEREIGRPMRWWDFSRGVRCSFAEITEIVKNIAPS